MRDRLEVVARGRLRVSSRDRLKVGWCKRQVEGA